MNGLFLVVRSFRFGLNVFILADGRSQQRLTAIGTVEFAGKSLEISIALEYEGDEILLGIEFLAGLSSIPRHPPQPDHPHRRTRPRSHPRRLTLK